MKTIRNGAGRLARVAAFASSVLLGLGGGAHAQLGKSQGLADINTLPEAELEALPHLAPASVKAILEARPFSDAIELSTLLQAQGLSAEQATELFRKAFVHSNLNTASSAEIQLIPGAGKRMAHEFEEYRPWKSWAQFDKEISKYVGPEETARLAQYGFIPLDPNTASDADLRSLPGVGKRIVGEIKEYRPWKSRAHFEKELGKYVAAKEAQRLARYFVFPAAASEPAK